MYHCSMRETRSSRDPFLWLFAISILGFLDVVAQLHGIVAAPGEIADAVSRAEAQLPNGAGVIVGFGLAVLPYLAWFLLRRRLHDNAVLVALCVGTLLAVVTGGLFVSDAVARGRTGSAGGSPSASATRVGYQRGETAAISAFEYDAGNVVAPAGGSGTAQGEIAALASLK